jgi:hypothetical protein
MTTRDLPVGVTDVSALHILQEWVRGEIVVDGRLVEYRVDTAAGDLDAPILVLTIPGGHRCSIDLDDLFKLLARELA